MSVQRKVQLNDGLRREYETLFAAATVKPGKMGVIDRSIDRILRDRDRYEKVSRSTTVPWFFIAALHHLECNGNFGKHLHNGDPLSAPTVRVPAGRPPGTGPFTWEASAEDALRLKKLDQVGIWGLAEIAYHAERYNGFGYRLHHPNVKSPYLWSFTSLYTAGKYVADRVFDQHAVSDQAGVMALLKRMLERGVQGVSLAGAKLSSDAGLEPVPAGGKADPDVVAPPDLAAGSEGTAPPAYPERVLRRGDQGEAVEHVQKRLLALGLHDAGAPDGHFGPLTEAAVKLFQARAVTPAGVPLAVDGVVGPVTWQALFGGAGSQQTTAGGGAVSNLVAEVLRIAEGEVGVRETPGQPNRGARVDEYLARVGLSGKPWCVAFLYWCFDEAARSLRRGNPMPQTASVWDHWRRARRGTNAVVVTAAAARSDPSLLRPGMIFHLDSGGGKGHAGLVTDILDNRRIATVEGNTNPGGGRDGDGVYRRQRDIRDIDMGFVGYV